MTAAPVRLGTKAESLARVAPLLRGATVLPGHTITLGRWRVDRAGALAALLARSWGGAAVIVRSSAPGEDQLGSGTAGRYRSIPGRVGATAVAEAVDAVFASYDTAAAHAEVLIQPQLTDVRAHGVARTADPATGAPTTTVSWTEDGRTDAVTGGLPARLHTCHGVPHHESAAAPDRLVADVWALLDELRDLTAHPALDVEFAVVDAGGLVLLQVRPLPMLRAPLDERTHRTRLRRVATQVADAAAEHHRAVLGARPLFGVMPDWNPAELVGLRPRGLAASVFTTLVGEHAWSSARHRHGYRDLRGVPLLHDLGGHLYVDVRASFSSLVPAAVPDRLAAHLVEHWLQRLRAQPHRHDRVESQVVVAELGLTVPDRLRWLREEGIPAADLALFTTALRRLTNTLIGGPQWRLDLARARRCPRDAPATVHAPGCDATDPACCGRAIAARIRRCATDGVEPFAGLARAAFVARRLLDDLVAEAVLTSADRDRLTAGAGITRQLVADRSALPRAEFLARYGHLRPGTFDIRSPRYDEDPQRYFGDHPAGPGPAPDPEPFAATARQQRSIERLAATAGLAASPRHLLDFAAAAIRAREQAKFRFSAVVSDALRDLARWGERRGCDPEELSHVELATIAGLDGRAAADRAAIARSSAIGRAHHEQALTLTLPALLTAPDDVWVHHEQGAHPTFVTTRRVRGRVGDVDAGDRLEGAVAFVVAADPGYDWVFTRGIVGVVTAFGGVNSHLALRATECGIPAVIGAGLALYDRWRAAGVLEIDAACGRVLTLP